MWYDSAPAIVPDLIKLGFEVSLLVEAALFESDNLHPSSGKFRSD
jgi:hypothetical protein